MKEFRYLIGAFFFCAGLLIETVAAVVCCIGVCVGYGYKDAKEYWEDHL